MDSMSNPCANLPIDVEIRGLAPGDSLDDLTDLIHRAFEVLAGSGTRCAGADQTAAETARRAGRGQCLLAIRQRRLVGTLTMEAHDPESPCAWYRRPDVGTLHQFAVEPSQQGRGCGSLLLGCAEQWARDQGLRELALETPETAGCLVAYYLSRGFRSVQRWRKQGATYTSLVLSKPVAVGRSNPPMPWLSPHRRIAW